MYKRQEGERLKRLRELESESRKFAQTQLFIETPYRNRALFDSLLQSLQPTTRLCVATDLTLPGESIRTRSIQRWKKESPPELDRRPTVFLLLA